MWIKVLWKWTVWRFSIILTESWTLRVCGTSWQNFWRQIEWPDLVILSPDLVEFVKNLMTKITKSGRWRRRKTASKCLRLPRPDLWPPVAKSIWAIAASQVSHNICCSFVNWSAEKRAENRNMLKAKFSKEQQIPGFAYAQRFAAHSIICL